MTDFNELRPLGRTNLMVNRLGISSSFGAPAAAYEEAFERGCNYVTWGTFVRGKSSEMKTAIGNIIAAGKRDRLVVGMLTYAHNALLTEYFFTKGLQAAGLDYADVLLLGYFPGRPSQRIIEGALKLKDNGLVRHIGLTGHNRGLFPKLVDDDVFDVFHIRYNAVHRGAETDTFPFLDKPNRPGIVSFTATDWRKLLNPKKMPPGDAPASATDCYRFVLSNPMVDVCMMGAKTAEQMRENLNVLAMGPLDEAELARMHRIGDHIYR